VDPYAFGHHRPADRRPDETVISMSVSAANDALADAGIKASDVDAVIVATVSHLMQTPRPRP
jgi:3-oxoacyl-[acyl-carrier-protein] synthase III